MALVRELFAVKGIELDFEVWAVKTKVCFISYVVLSDDIGLKIF